LVRNNLIISLLFFCLFITSCASYVKYPYFSASSIDGYYGVFGDRKEGQIVLREITSGRIVKTWTGNIFDEIGGNINFTIDNRYFIIPIKNCAEVWNLRNGTHENNFFVDSDIYYVVTDLTSSYLAASDKGGNITLWQLDNKKKIWKVTFKENYTASFAHRLIFSKDGKYLAAGSFGIMKIYEISSGREVKQITWSQKSSTERKSGQMTIDILQALDNIFASHPSKYGVTSMSISNNNNYISAGLGNYLLMWNFRTGKLIWSKQEEEKIFGIDFYPDDRYVITFSVDPLKEDVVKNWTVNVRDVNYGNVIISENIQNVVSFSPDGRIFTWNPQNNKIITYLWGGEWIDVLTGTSFDDGITNIVDKIASQMMLQGWKRVALAQFTCSSEAYKNFERYLIEELITKFSHTKDFTVVEKHLFERALAELGVTLSDVIKPVTDTQLSVGPTLVNKLGLLTGADTIIVGTISETTGKVKINTNLVDTERGEIQLEVAEEVVKDENILRLLGIPSVVPVTN
jgi:WD40 repeat protein